MHTVGSSRLETAYQLSRLPERDAPTMLPVIDFDELVHRSEEMARNELLVARRPEVHADYLAFQAELKNSGDTLHGHISKTINDLGNVAARAVLLTDEYPAEVLPSGDSLPVFHYNLWLSTLGSVPDFRAGDDTLAQLENRDPEREVYCFKRPPTQSVPRNGGFSFEHAHVFTTATISSRAITVPKG